MVGVSDKILNYAASLQQFSVDDIPADVISDVERNTLSWHLSNLCKKGKLRRVGRGIYTIQTANTFLVKTNAKVRSLYRSLLRQYPFTDFCVYSANVITPLLHDMMPNNTIYVETNRDTIMSVFEMLLPKYKGRLFLAPTKEIATTYIEFSRENIIVKPLVTEAPLTLDGKVPVPTLEKLLVDTRVDADYSYLQGYEPVISWDRLTMVIPIRSEKAVGNIEAELIAGNEEVSPFKPQSMSARTQRLEDGLWAVRFNLSLFSDRTNGDYPCIVRISGSDADSKELMTDLPMVIHIRDGKTNTEPAQISISENATSLSVGEDGVIAVKLTNASRSVGFENLSLTLSDPSGDILPKKLDTVVLGDLMPGESLDLSFPVTVLSSAKVTPHSGQSLGQETKLSVSYTVPVRQEIRLEQGGLRMAESVVAGDSITATLPLMNMGKADIINAMVTISLPGITERQSVLVGTIQPGETKQAQITLTAPKDVLGSFDGTLTVTGEDNDSNSVSFDLPVSLNVEEAGKTDVLDTQGTAKQKTPVSVIVLSIVCAVLVAALITQSILLRGKLHRLEEERL